MLIDAPKWFSFWKKINCTTDSPHGVAWKLIGIISYSVAMSVATCGVMVFYVWSMCTDGGSGYHERSFEWISMFGLCCQFMSQSVHGLSFFTRSVMGDTQYTPLKTDGKKYGEGMYVM